LKNKNEFNKHDTKIMDLPILEPSDVLKVTIYYRRSHMTEAQFRQIIKCFALDLIATQNKKTISHRATEGTEFLLTSHCEERFVPL